MPFGQSRLMDGQLPRKDMQCGPVPLRGLLDVAVQMPTVSPRRTRPEWSIAT
jgi:hypothetical protein